MYIKIPQLKPIFSEFVSLRMNSCLNVCRLELSVCAKFMSLKINDSCTSWNLNSFKNWTRNNEYHSTCKKLKEFVLYGKSEILVFHGVV